MNFERIAWALVPALLAYTCPCWAQNSSTDLNLVELCSYDSVRVRSESKPKWSCNYDHWHSIFCDGGKHLLICDFPNSKLLLMDSRSGQVQTVSADPRVYRAVLIPETGGVIVFKVPSDVAISQDRKVERTVTDINLDLTHFRSLEQLIKNTEPEWVLTEPDVFGQSIHWLDDRQMFAIVDHLQDDNRRVVAFVNAYGKFLSSINVDGAIIGVDSSESRIELFVVSKQTNLISRVWSCQVNGTLDGLVNRKNLFNCPFSFSGDNFTRILLSSHLRLGKCQAGDVHTYVTKVMSQPGYWSYSDYSLLRSSAGGNPWSRVSADHLHKLRINGRWFNLNVLASAESAHEVEFIIDNGIGAPALCATHDGGLIALPDRYFITDVVKEDGKYLISTENSISGPEKSVTRTTVFELSRR